MGHMHGPILLESCFLRSWHVEVCRLEDQAWGPVLGVGAQMAPALLTTLGVVNRSLIRGRIQGSFRSD